MPTHSKQIPSASARSINFGLILDLAVFVTLAVGCGPAAEPQPIRATTHSAPVSNPAAAAPTAATAGAPLPKIVSPSEEALKLSGEADKLFGQGKLTEGILLLEKALKLSPEDEELHFDLAYFLARQGRTEEAVRHYRESLRLLPDYAEAHNNLGNLLAKQGELAEAVTHFEAVLTVAPQHSGAHNNLGNALARQGKLADAAGHFREATQLKPTYAEAWLNLGNAYVEQGRSAEAIEPFENALRANPNLIPAQKALQRLRAKITDGAR